MKLLFRKISKTPIEFEITHNEITFKGYLQYDSGKLFLLKAKIFGNIFTPCDVCAEDFALKIDEEVEYFLSEGIYENNSDSFLEVVEIFSDSVDLDELLASEIALITSDYKSCDDCKAV